jgi:hypothetical protein
VFGSLGLVRILFFAALLLGSCGYALLRGKWDARVVAIVSIVAVFLTWAVQSPNRSSYSSIEWGVFLVDLGTFAVFTFVALNSDRFWPLWVSGLQLTTILGHLLKAFDNALLPLAYSTALRFWSYPILIILIVAVWKNHRNQAWREKLPN